MHPRELFTSVTTEVVQHQSYHSAPWSTLSNSRLSVFRRNPQEFYQRFVTGEIEDDDDKACLKFGRVLHEAVLEPKTVINQDNVMADTLAIFRTCAQPSRKPDVEIGNTYAVWFQDLPEPGIVVRSSMWGEMTNGRVWLINGKGCLTDQEIGEQPQCGYCAYADMIKSGDHFVTIPEDVLSSSGSRTGKEWKAFESAQRPGTVTYKPKEWFGILAMRRELRTHPETRRMLFGPHGPQRHTEFTIRGVDRETGIDIQSRLDFCHEFLDGVLVVDLKSSRDASPGCWRRQAEKDGLHVQAAIQIGMAEALFDRQVKFRFAVAQKDAPYRVEVYELEDEFVEIGVEDYLRDVRRFAECRANGIWQPARYGEVHKLETPSWRQQGRQLAWKTPEGDIDYSFEDDEL